MGDVRESGYSIDDGIAIVGISCRFPGAADPIEFWNLLASGSDAITEIPADRATLHELRNAVGEPGVGLGGFLPWVDLFDPEFFGISPGEAAAIDPQQRIMLELAWEALEDAGIKPDGGTPNMGVFLGTMSDDYSALTHRLGQISSYTFTGLQRSLIANRVSFALGLTGPSLTVDSGQSSSLIAVHLACESIRSGSSQVALAGAINLNFAPQNWLSAAKLGVLSPDGKCYAFDSRANGYVRGEGGGVLVLKRYQQAVADGDRIYCVIRGESTNNGGQGSEFLVPSQVAQEELLRSAYRNAGIDCSDVEYVELHGAGTRVGDPVEAAALGAVLGHAAQRDKPLLIGSVKTNIGHLEGAAGIAGIIKVALSLKHGSIPPSLNYREPNPSIPVDDLGLRLNIGLSALRGSRRGPSIAGVSSFGLGGTNAHVVLEQVRVESGPDRVGVQSVSGGGPWLLSGRSAAGLRAQAGKLREFLAERPDVDVADVGLSLATTRTRFSHRGIVVGGDRERLLAGLAALAEGGPASNVATGTELHGKTVFVFPGQGSQWLGMGRELLDSSPVFAEQMQACAQALSEFVDWSLLDVVRGVDDDDDGSALDRVDVLQPLLWAVMVSLAELWRSYGVQPDAVVGHSQGEIAAAYVAGALSLRESARIVALRSKALQRLAGRGGMMSLGMAYQQATERMNQFAGRLSIAAVNGADSVVVSGDSDALDTLLSQCSAEGIRASRIAVDYASHSAQVEVLHDELAATLSSCSAVSSRIPFYSTVTGEQIDTAALDGQYWYRNLRQTVQFESATSALLSAGHSVFVEVSPHPVLTIGVQETIDAVGADAVAVHTLVRDQGGLDRFKAAVGRAHVCGVAVDWATVFAGTGARRTPLPTYAFQRQRFWLDTAA
ncbi:type I polyketide synthase, partial [Nocardia nepalensis]|uniref:type I polyketide synthase n=1 Tax=Nocardia nepalensis TaxID=3375448 RepID=UPI003B67C390